MYLLILLIIKNKYLEIYNEFKKHPEKVSVVGEVEFDIELVQTDRVDVDYILQLLRKAGEGTPGSRTIDAQTILKILRRSTDPVLMSKRELLELFISTIFPTMPEGASVDEELAKFIEEQREEEIRKQHEETEIAMEDLRKLIARFDYFKEVDNADIKTLLSKRVKNRFRERHPDYNVIKANNELMKMLKEWVAWVSEKYSVHE